MTCSRSPAGFADALTKACLLCCATISKFEAFQLWQRPHKRSAKLNTPEHCLYIIAQTCFGSSASAEDLLLYVRAVCQTGSPWDADLCIGDAPLTPHGRCRHKVFLLLLLDPRCARRYIKRASAATVKATSHQVLDVLAADFLQHKPRCT